jgi:putative lipoprotein
VGQAKRDGPALASSLVGVVLAAVVVLAPAPRARAAEPDPWFARDKALHFGATFTLAGGGYAGAALISPRESVRTAAGAGLGLGAGIAKEIYDRYSGGHPSWRDLTWDMVGTATGLLTAWLLDRYVF